MDKYLEIIKEKSFIRSFIIMLVLACVGYSYNFQDVMTGDDYPFVNSVISDTAMAKRSIFSDPRAIARILEVLFSGSSAAKNAVLFLALVGYSFFAVFFCRVVFKVQSIFWTVLISLPIVINAGIEENYQFVVNVTRLIPLVFALALALAVYVENNRKSIALSSLYIFLIMWTYQPILMQYICAVVIIVICRVIQENDQDFKTTIIKLGREKVIPSMIVLVIGVLVYFTAMKLLLHSQSDRVFQAFPENSHLFGNLLHNVSIILNTVVYQFYDASFHHSKEIFRLLFVFAMIGAFLKMRKNGENIKNTVLKLALINVMFWALPLIISFYQLSAGYIRENTLRTMVPYSLMISLLLYLIHVGFNQVKYLKKIYPVLLFTFALNMMNQTVYQAYTLLNQNKATLHNLNRLVDDIFDYAREQKYVPKDDQIPVILLEMSFFNGFPGGRQELHSKHPEIHNELFLVYDQEPLKYYFPFAQFARLGAMYNIRKIFNKAPGISEICEQAISDKTLNHWPFYNSMKFINGVLVVKLHKSYPKGYCHALRPSTMFGYFQFNEGYIKQYE